MSNVAKFNEQMAVELGLPAAIIFKRFFKDACDIAAQLESDAKLVRDSRSCRWQYNRW